jgi:putative MATE family efflux protein
MERVWSSCKKSIEIPILMMSAYILIMGANEEMMSLAESYGRLFIISCVIGTLNVSMSNIIVSQGASKTSASAMIIGSIVNVALDPLFIYTFNWGVEGAAWATILSRIVTTAIYIRFLTKAEVKVSLALFAPTIRIYADIIKIGISMLFLQLLQTLSISLLQKAAVKYGAEAVAAVGIVLKIVTLGTNVVFGFVKGLQPMAGYNYGAGNFQRLREAVCCSLILTTSFCVLWSILIVIFTSPIISCFGKDETMQEIARIALRANTIMFFTFGFQFVYSTLYMAIGRARQSLLLNIGRQGLFFIPTILLLPSYWGLNGVLYVQPIADVFATLMTLLFAVRIHREIGHQSHLTTENI